MLVASKPDLENLHSEIPVDQKDPTLAVSEARKTLERFVTKELTEAADFPLKFE